MSIIVNSRLFIFNESDTAAIVSDFECLVSPLELIYLSREAQILNLKRYRVKFCISNSDAVGTNCYNNTEID